MGKSIINTQLKILKNRIKNILVLTEMDNMHKHLSCTPLNSELMMHKDKDR